MALTSHCDCTLLFTATSTTRFISTPCQTDFVTSTRIASTCLPKFEPLRLLSSVLNASIRLDLPILVSPHPGRLLFSTPPQPATTSQVRFFANRHTKSMPFDPIRLFSTLQYRPARIDIPLPSLPNPVRRSNSYPGPPAFDPTCHTNPPRFMPTSQCQPVSWPCDFPNLFYPGHFDNPHLLLPIQSDFPFLLDSARYRHTPPLSVHIPPPRLSGIPPMQADSTDRYCPDPLISGRRLLSPHRHPTFHFSPSHRDIPRQYIPSQHDDSIHSSAALTLPVRQFIPCLLKPVDTSLLLPARAIRHAWSLPLRTSRSTTLHRASVSDDPLHHVSLHPPPTRRI